MPLPQQPRELDDLWKLLPGNATRLERDVLKSVPYTSVLQKGITDMPAVGDTVIPDDWKIWILQEKGLLPLLEAIDNIDLVLAESDYLIENRGTLAAVVRVCRMLGYSGASVWEHEWATIHFSEFQVHLGRTMLTSQDSLIRLEKAINAIKPLRSRLRRVYGGDEDVRRLILSRKGGRQNNVLGRQLIGHFSGYPSAHNPELWVSFIRENSLALKTELYGSGLALKTFPYRDYGIASGLLIDDSSNLIVTNNGDNIKWVTYISEE